MMPKKIPKLDACPIKCRIAIEIYDVKLISGSVIFSEMAKFIGQFGHVRHFLGPR
jgi:hypothetical protein